MSDQQHWENLYNQPLETIPWEIASPPNDLVDVLASRLVIPTLTLDVGCGTGNYTNYLEAHGFQTVGVDFSEAALTQAQQKNQQANLSSVFLYLDVRELTKHIKSQFGFIFEYSLLHHISDQDLEAYTKQFPQLLQRQGKLLIVCYTPEHKRSQGKRHVTGKAGNTMYFRSAEEIQDLYSELTLVQYKKTRLGKDDEHPAHSFLFEKP